jgi:hypothetical protein
VGFLVVILLVFLVMALVYGGMVLAAPRKLRHGQGEVKQFPG